MLITKICREALTSPSAALPLLFEAINDRLGKRLSVAPASNLIQLLRFVHSQGGDFTIGTSEIGIAIPTKPVASKFVLRQRDSDVRVFREVIEHAVYDCFPELNCRTTHPLRIVDAGGNIGLSTIFFKRRFPTAEVIFVEPETQCYEIAIEHFRMNKLDGVQPVHAGLWPSSGSLKLIQDPGSDLSWSTRVALEPAGDIDAVSISALMRSYQWNFIDLLKIDIEGAEFPLLQDPSAEEWLRMTRRIVGEYHPSLGDSVEFIECIRSHGFSVDLFGANMFVAKNLNLLGVDQQ